MTNFHFVMFCRFSQPFEGCTRYAEFQSHESITGTFHGKPAIMYLYQNPDYESIKPRFLEIEGLRHHNLGLFLGVEHLEDCFLVAYEISDHPINCLNFRKCDFKITKHLVSSFTNALAVIHHKGFVHTSLRAVGSYIYCNTIESHFKLSIEGCHKIGSAKALGHTKLSNVNDLADSLYKLFVNPDSSYKNLPQKDFDKLGTKTAYGEEILDFISKLRTCNNLKDMINHPFFWPCEKRLDFIQDIRERSKTMKNIANSVNILNEVVVQQADPSMQADPWSWMDKNVRDDLKINLDDEKAKLKMKHPNFGATLLAGVRNFKVHDLVEDVVRGKSVYTTMSRDTLKGLDLYLSYEFPTFFMKVFRKAKNTLTPFTDYPHFRKYLDPQYDLNSIDYP
ncbi:hypothetical protein CASFOL_031744 [Castilleja foliolosa]|uniref:Protein kinase domain-containing protein n=1 Tax=Castilleja foliolosa TaxID=1961234 RepID=A0ABD3C7H7_9LAMI